MCFTVIKWWGLIAVPVKGPNCPSYCQPLPVSAPVGAVLFAAGSEVKKRVTASARKEVRIDTAMIAIGKSRRVIFSPDECRFLAQSYKNYKNQWFLDRWRFFLFAFSPMR